MLLELLGWTGCHVMYFMQNARPLSCELLTHYLFYTLDDPGAKL